MLRYLCFLFPLTALAAQPALDGLNFGVADSEAAHAVTASQSEVRKGAMDQPARILLPGGAQPWEGGKVSFKMKVDPVLPNYFTAKFSGDEKNSNLLILFCEGKQIGYRHLGDIDILALPDDEPRYNGRFYYATTPLPKSLTAGKTEVNLEIRSTGPVWGYGSTFEQYQKAMKDPSRAVYLVATHTDGCYIPAANEAQGAAPTEAVRAHPGEEVLELAKQRVTKTLNGLLDSKRPLNQMQAQFLAKAYSTKWTVAFQNPKVPLQISRCADDRYAAWKLDPAKVWHDPATWNPDWFGLGPMADAVRLVAQDLGSSLDEKLDGEKTRRAAWSEMFQASRDWLRTHRRWYTNQTFFVDTNMYRSHRALQVIDPERAWPEEQAKRYLNECMGLAPWTGSDTETGADKKWGDHYFQITDKGLSKELGYVGGYGEILGQMVDAYEATSDPGKEGDARFKAQIAKLQRARLYFRYPMSDEEGNRAMRLETDIGWRDPHFPGAVTYAQRSGQDETGLYAAAVTLDPAAVGAVQQMFEDNQLFSSVQQLLNAKGLRAEFGLLSIPEDYEKLRAQPAANKPMPMSKGQPDVVFADEENGVVAIKHGDEILYVSLYWRARMGINKLARVHYLKPQHQQVAVVEEEAKFEPSGKTWKRPNWTNFGFANGGFHYPDKIDSAHAGEELPIAKYPDDVPFDPKQENPYAGRAEFYQLRFGPYLIAMNTTKAKTFEIARMAGFRSATDLASKKRIAWEAPIKLEPRQTMVFYLDANSDSKNQ